MIVRYVLAWLPMVLIAILNGALRETWYGKSLSELSAHQISTLTGAVLFALYIWALSRLWPLASGRQALDAQGTLPLLAPMSAIAGNMAITIGNYYLAKFNNGKGIQLGTVLGTRSGKVVIIGDGIVGRHAARTADGMGASVFLFGRQRDRAAQLAQELSPHLRFFESTPDTIAGQLEEADLVVSAVLVRGAKAPHVVTEGMVQRLQPGSVIVDVSIDQGGCIATSRPTSHSEPVFARYGIIHYCVTNMPGAYPGPPPWPSPRQRCPTCCGLPTGPRRPARRPRVWQRGAYVQRLCDLEARGRGAGPAVAVQGILRPVGSALPASKPACEGGKTV